MIVGVNNFLAQFKNGIKDEIQMAVTEVCELFEQIVYGSDAKIFIFLVANMFDDFVQLNQELWMVIDGAGKM